MECVKRFTPLRCTISYMNSFTKNLALLLKEHELHQNELAKRLNLSPQTINRYIKGEREPYFDTAIKIAKFFDITVGQLLGTEEY